MNIDKIELRLITIHDYADLKDIMERVYKTMPNSAWNQEQIETLTTIFPEGQVGIIVDGKLVACALTLIVNYSDVEKNHTYAQITGQYTFNTHQPNGDTLYGIDVFIDPDYRGMRLGRRLYDYRK
jgi:ribosomal protein S18 acetylase RimI-like enzyme